MQRFITPQQLHRALYAPVVDKVSKLVTNSYLNVLPGLPYTELPVITMMEVPPTAHTTDAIALWLQQPEGQRHTDGDEDVEGEVPQDEEKGRHRRKAVKLEAGGPGSVHPTNSITSDSSCTILNAPMFPWWRCVRMRRDYSTDRPR